MHGQDLEYILREKSSACTQFPDSGDSLGIFSSLDNTSTCAHVDANKESEMCTLEGYTHFTFDDNEWCNLCNEDDPNSYRDTFSQPDMPQWQSAYNDEMRSLHKHKVWDLVPCDQVPTG